MNDLLLRLSENAYLSRFYRDDPASGLKPHAGRFIRLIPQDIKSLAY
jgi:hypothetical protein